MGVPRRHDHDLAPLVIVGVSHQQADFVIVDGRLGRQVLLERPVDEVHPACCWLAQEAAAFHQVAEDIGRLSADLVQVQQRPGDLSGNTVGGRV